jgi:hypothetical protein
MKQLLLVDLNFLKATKVPNLLKAAMVLNEAMANRVENCPQGGNGPH